MASVPDSVHISIHAPREGCDTISSLVAHGPSTISIHAPREGCDGPESGAYLAYLNISIHAPREGCDATRWQTGVRKSLFQSTHPARGATFDGFIDDTINSISIHAPREGCDQLSLFIFILPCVFQSTHPARGATPSLTVFESIEADFNPRTPRGVRHLLCAPLPGTWHISIHAPREGCDVSGAKRRIQAILHFNPRTPRGVRQQTLPKSREFAWLNLLICTRGRRLSIQKQTRLCSIKLSFMLFGCEPAGEGVSSWTSHATKSKVRLEGRSA